jgi:hypothetical protein
MALYARKAKRTEFELPPAGVPIDAELVEIQDLGEVEGRYGPKLRLMFRYKTSLMDKKREPIQVREFLTNTTDERGKLAPRIFSITGSMPDPSKDYPLEPLVGAKVQIVCAHRTTEEGVTYANIASLIRQPTKKEAASEARVQRVIDAAKKKPKEENGS